jgi:methyl-accepting chemotaxis protein
MGHEINLLDSDTLGFRGLAEAGGRMVGGERGTVEYFRPDGTRGILFFSPVPHTPGWSLAVVVPPEELHATANRSAKFLLTAMAVAVLVLSGISFFIGNTIAHPIRNIMGLAVRAGDGDFSFDRNAFGITSRDELVLWRTHGGESDRPASRDILWIFAAKPRLSPPPRRRPPPPPRRSPAL